MSLGYGLSVWHDRTSVLVRFWSSSLQYFSFSSIGRYPGLRAMLAMIEHRAIFEICDQLGVALEWSALTYELLVCLQHCCAFYAVWAVGGRRQNYLPTDLALFQDSCAHSATHLVLNTLARVLFHDFMFTPSSNGLELHDN